MSYFRAGRRGDLFWDKVEATECRYRKDTPDPRCSSGKDRKKGGVVGSVAAWEGRSDTVRGQFYWHQLGGRPLPQTETDRDKDVRPHVRFLALTLQTEWFWVAVKPKQSYPEQVSCGGLLGPKGTDLTLDAAPVPRECERCTRSRLPYLMWERLQQTQRPSGDRSDSRGGSPRVGNSSEGLWL